MYLLRNTVIAVVFFSNTAAADVFAFKDIAGFKECLQTKHLVITNDTKTGKQSQFLARMDVQEKCFLQAKKVVSKEKSAVTIGKWIEVGFANSDNDNSIDLIGLQINRDLKFCNESGPYNVFLSLMDMPAKKSPESLYQRAKKAIETCLKDKQFRQDFLDEQDSSKDSFRYKNICSILKGAGLIKVCFGR